MHHYITYQNLENGYSVLQASVKGFREKQTHGGTFHEVAAGACPAVEGEWKVDKRHGRLFATVSWSEEKPATIVGTGFKNVDSIAKNLVIPTTTREDAGAASSTPSTSSPKMNMHMPNGSCRPNRPGNSSLPTRNQLRRHWTR